MPSKTSQIFEANRASNKPTLIGYFPIGYPTLGESIEAAVNMCESGVDILELGIPYSDPVMDGPVIQEATELALQNGFKLNQIFEAVSQITKRVKQPVLVMTYWNPVMQYGVDKFAADLAEAGGAGLITPDLIPDEAQVWLSASEEHELDRIFFATPTSTPERTKIAAQLSRGFIYCVSTMGITGTREQLDSFAQKVVATVSATGVVQNKAVGIGVSTAEQVRDIHNYADAAIVGSAFVKAYASGGITQLAEVVKSLKG